MTHLGQEKTAIAGTPVEITRLGFGCARLFSGSEAKASTKLIEAALRAGIRHFDTAPSYASEQSERVLGDVLAGVEDATVTTKFGLPYSAVGATGAMSLYRTALRPVLARAPALKSGLLNIMQRARRSTARSAERPLRKLSRDDVLRSFEGSLARLKRDYIDIYLAHEPDHLVIDDALTEILGELQANRQIGAFGRAWDRSVSSVEPFGQIVQCRYSADDVSDNAHVRIFHGALRHGHGEDGNRKGRAPDRILAAIKRHPSSAVLFSASHPSQVHEIGSILSAVNPVDNSGASDGIASIP